MESFYKFSIILILIIIKYIEAIYIEKKTKILTESTLYSNHEIPLN